MRLIINKGNPPKIYYLPWDKIFAAAGNQSNFISCWACLIREQADLEGLSI